MAAGDETIPSQFRKGVVELAILALLHNGEAYGAEIVDRLGAYPGLAITAGTAYPLLSRLKKAGLIASAWQESPVGPPRKYYRLSPTGGAAFVGMSLAWKDMKDAMDHLLESEATNDSS
jgi:PadR family transcriptional regulator PadR